MKLDALARIVSGSLVGDGTVEITGVKDLLGAGPGDLSFVQSARHVEAARSSRAAAFLVPEGEEVEGRPCIQVPNPKFSFIVLLSRFLPAPVAATGIHPGAWVAEGVQTAEGVGVGPGATVEPGTVLGPRVQVGPGCFVGAGCRLGADTRLHANVTLYGGTILGERVVIHAGTVVGADGFGYVQEGKRGEADAGAAIERYMQVEGPHVKVPQLGNVVVGDDVELGACVTVDRATLGSTIIGRGSKIDNQVQIGHNCRIGEDVVIVAEVGIGGSVTVGDHVTIGGNCGISESVRIGAYCIVGAHTLIYPGKRFPPRKVILGNPAREAVKTLEQQTAIMGLPRLVRRLERVEARLKELEAAPE